MKKVLFTAKVDSHIIQFHIPYLKLFKEAGYEVHVASAGDSNIPFVDHKHDVSFGTNPFSAKTVENYKILKEIMFENDFDIVHTHTAIASALTRLANHKVNDMKARKNRLIYTAHGYHFLKGGPKSSWILYYPIEKYLSKYTEDLILINKEDYDLAQKHKMAKNIHYVPGVGLDVSKFPDQLDENILNQSRAEFGIEESTFVISYVAEINNNKNHMMLLNAVKDMTEAGYKLKLLLCGDGDLEDELKAWTTTNNLDDNIKFLGYTNRISEVLQLSDAYVSVSKREGLPLNVIEAMYNKLPIIVTNCRGNRDLVVNNENGFVIGYSVETLIESLKNLIEDTELRSDFSQKSRELSLKYTLDHIYSQMSEIYHVDQDGA